MHECTCAHVFVQGHMHVQGRRQPQALFLGTHGTTPSSLHGRRDLNLNHNACAANAVIQGAISPALTPGFSYMASGIELRFLCLQDKPQRLNYLPAHLASFLELMFLWPVNDSEK